MSSDTFYIKEGEHFKLWVSLKNKIAFEAELVEQGIPYHIDDNQSTLGSDIRYFMADEYKEQIDNVIKHTGIIASTDTIPATDIEVSRHVNRMYLTVAGIVILLLAVGTMIFGCKNGSSQPNEEKNEVVKGKYYFDFDEVVYYSASDKYPDPDQIREKEVKTKIDTMTIEIMQGYLPQATSDTIYIAYFDSIGFKKKIIPEGKQNALREIFREKSVENSETAACAWTYRDFYLFKKKGKVTGIAKLCYECGIDEFIGTTASTIGFGYYGEYGQLREIVKQ